MYRFVRKMTSYLSDGSSEKKILKFERQIFRSDYSAQLRSRLSITVLEKKMKGDSRIKK